MHTLTDQQVVNLWEITAQQHIIDKVLRLLSLALPEHSYQALAELSIGQRNRYLFTIREHYFGRYMQCIAKCSHCKEQQEFTLDTHTFNRIESKVPSEKVVTIQSYTLNFNLLTSLDLAKAAAHSNVDDAEHELLRSCIVSITCAGEPCLIEDLSTDVLDEFKNHLKEIDPLIKIPIQINCALCSGQSEILFDIAAFLWEELSAKAKQLLDEVHKLAYVYGWAEESILAMSSQRRQLYLSKIIK